MAEISSKNDSEASYHQQGPSQVTDGQPAGKPQKDLQHQLSKEGKKESGSRSAVIQSLSNPPAKVGECRFHERKLRPNLSKAIQLISFADNKLSLNSEAQYLISTIDKPVAVLSICGPTRTGKSYLMSKIVGSDVFKVTNLIDPCTKGIWLSPIILETEDMAVIFLDSEGMDAPQNDHNLNGEVEMFVILIVLLSSYLIYNTRGEATIQFLESLRYFGECSKKMLVDVKGQQGEHRSQELKALKEYFPDFLWLLRDSTLVPTNNSNKKTTIEEYMEKKVLVIEGDPKSKRNEAKLVLKEAFPSRSFKQMPYPGNTETPDAKDFLQAIEDVKQLVFQKIKPKCGLNEDHGLKGPYLARLLKQYVDSLKNDGGSIMLEKSYFNAIQIEVYQIIDNLVDTYTEKMRHSLTDQANPLEEGDLAELQKSHAAMANDCVHKWKKFFSEKTHYCIESNTLFACHLRIYHDLLQSLCETMEKLLSKNRESCNEFKNELIIVLEQRLVRIDLSAANQSEKVKLNCSLKQFMTENYQKSKDYCRESFETAYSKQQDANLISITRLRKNYFSLAIGPAKYDVFNSQISEIPEIPLSVKLYNVSYNSFTVSWKVPQSGEKAGQVVEAYCSRDRHFQEENLVVHKIQLSEGHFEFTGLKPRTEYFIKVRGLAKKRYEKFGEFSEVLNCKTPWSVPDKPSKPESITIDPADPSKATLVINLLSDKQKRGSPITNLIIEHEMQTEWQVLEEVQAARIENDIVITLPSLDDKKKFGSSDSFSFRVIMCNEFGLSQPSESITLPFKDLLPGKPTVLSCRMFSAHVIHIEWQRPALHKALPITYELEYSLVGKPETKLTEIIGAEQDHFLTGLIPKSTYTITLKAKFNSFGPSTEPLQVNTVELGVKEDEVSYSSIRVSWNVPQFGEKVGQLVEAHCSEDRSFQEQSLIVNEVQLSQGNCEFRGLKPKKEYFIKVRGLVKEQYEKLGEFSELLDCKTLWSVPDTPTKPESISVDRADPSKATLVINLLSEEQKRGSPVTKLIIEHKTQTEWQVLEEVHDSHIQSSFSITLLVITLPSLDDKKEFGSSDSFSFRVIMCNEFGSSQPSESITLPFKDLLPGMPTDLRCKKSSAHAIQVEWKRPVLHKALPITYELEYSLVGKPSAKRTKIIGAEQDHFLTGLIQKSSYNLTLKAKFNNFGPSTKPLHVNTDEYSSPGLSLKCEASSKSIEVKWRCPTEDRREVLRYDIECRECELADYEKSKHIFKEDKKILSVIIPDLNSWTNYTVAVTPVFGINPELITGPTEKIQCSTLMGTTSRRTLKAAGTVLASGAVGAMTVVAGAPALAAGGFALVSTAVLGAASYATE